MKSTPRKQEVLELDPQRARRPNGRPSEAARTRRPVPFKPIYFCPSTETLVDYLKATSLSPQDHEAVRLHLVDCAACKARIVSLRDSLNLARSQVRSSRAALALIAGLAAAVALWFGWIYYVELRVQRQETLVNLLDFKLQAQTLLAEAPAAQVRLSRGPDRPPSLGPLGQLWITPAGAIWKKRVQLVTQRYFELTQKDPDLAAELPELGLLLILSGAPGAAVAVLTSDGSRPSEPDLLNDLGAARLAAGQVSEAQADLLEALRLRPSFKQPAFNLALALEIAGEQQKAAAQWLEYLTMDPQSDWAIHAQRHLAALNSRS